MALRRHLLPHEDDELDNLARALWLEKRQGEQLTRAVAEGIAYAFNG
ncbi:DUF6890 family protein [Aeromonas hydrophila]